MSGDTDVGFTAVGRTPDADVTGGIASVVSAGFTEFLPSENPIPKKTAHRMTSPKNRASILPVPRVISVSWLPGIFYPITTVSFLCCRRAFAGLAQQLL